MMDHKAMQELVDFTRGEIDREKGMECGYSGPVTTAYLDGYGLDRDWKRKAEAAASIESRTMHGWYT
jgi:hypothetical protein